MESKSGSELSKKRLNSDYMSCSVQELIVAYCVLVLKLTVLSVLHIYINVHFLVDKKCFYESHFPSFIYFKQMFFCCCMFVSSFFNPKLNHEKDLNQGTNKKFILKSFTVLRTLLSFLSFPDNTKKWT